VGHHVVSTGRKFRRVRVRCSVRRRLEGTFRQSHVSSPRRLGHGLSRLLLLQGPRDVSIDLPDGMLSGLYDVRYPLCGHAIMYRKKCLETLLTVHQKINMPLDIAMFYNSLPKLRVYTILPSIIGQHATLLARMKIFYFLGFWIYEWSMVKGKPSCRVIQNRPWWKPKLLK
jgi:hypothetical protein